MQIHPTNFICYLCKGPKSRYSKNCRKCLVPKGRYKISPEISFWKHVKKTPTCWIWIGAKDRLGYGTFGFNGKTVSAHRVAWTLANGTIPKGVDICHHCDIRSCIRISHLFSGTHTDNMRDCAKKGRLNSVRGERQHLAKLTKDNVIKIRTMHINHKATELAKMFNVSSNAIHNVIKRVTWKHIP